MLFYVAVVVVVVIVVKKDFILHSHDSCETEFLTDECVSNHRERIRSIQIDKFFITQTFRMYNFIISTVRKCSLPSY